MIYTAINKMGFHESSVIAFTFFNGDASLCIKDVMEADKSCSIEIHAPSSRLLIDDEVVENFVIPKADGEILSLKVSEKKLALLVEWHFYPGSKTITQEYIILANLITLRRINT